MIPAPSPKDRWQEAFDLARANGLFEDAAAGFADRFVAAHYAEQADEARMRMKESQP